VPRTKSEEPRYSFLRWIVQRVEHRQHRPAVLSLCLQSSDRIALKRHSESKQMLNVCLSEKSVVVDREQILSIVYKLL